MLFGVGWRWPKHTDVGELLNDDHVVGGLVGDEVTGWAGVLRAPVAHALGRGVVGQLGGAAPVIGGVDGGEHLVLQRRAATGQLRVGRR